MASVNLTTIAVAAIKFLAAIDSGGSLSSSQLDDALAAANNLLDSWSSQRLFALSDLITTVALVAGTQSYTIGSGGTINIVRPMAIQAASIKVAVYSSVYTKGLEIVNTDKWAKIPDRDSSGAIVDFLFYDRANAAGLGKVWLSPIPAGGTLEIHSWAALTQFADKTTTISIQPGYQRALEHALALELAPQWDIKVTDEMVAALKDSLAAVRTLNAELLGPEPPQMASSADSPTPIASPSGAPGSH